MTATGGRMERLFMIATIPRTMIETRTYYYSIAFDLRRHVLILAQLKYLSYKRHYKLAS